MRRPQKAYTKSEIEAFDDGFGVAMGVARAAMVRHIERFKTPADAAVALAEVQQEMIEWIKAQQERD